MVSVNRYVKFWILVSLCSLLVWILRWIPASLERFYNIVFVSWDYYPRIVVGGLMYSVASVGMVARLIGVILGLASFYMVWKGNKSFFKIRRMITTALALESVYYASLVPSVIWLFALGPSYGISFYTLGLGYFLNVLLTVPFLAVLAIKVYKYGKDPNGVQFWKWVGIAFCGYIVALWANAVFRWFELALADRMALLLGGSTGMLAWNAFILMSLAVFFAIFGGYFLRKQKKSAAIRWLGLALACVGLHYIFHVLVYYFDGALISVWLTDVWAIPLLGLGVSLLKNVDLLRKS